MRTLQILKTGFLLFIFSSSLAQTDLHLLSNWEYNIEEAAHEKINKVITSLDGFIIAVGETMGNSRKDTDGLFLVIDPQNGKKRFSKKKFGGTGNDAFKSVVQNFDGTFTLVGYKETRSRGDRKGWVLNIDPNGEVIDENLSAGGSGVNELVDIAINSKGSVLAIGMVYGNRTQYAWILPIMKGKPLTPSIIGRGQLNQVSAITSGSDDNFVLVGSTSIENRMHRADACVMKLDENGRDKWGGARFFGDSEMQTGLGIAASRLKGGYAIVGSSNTGPYGEEDVWVLKIGENGRKEWEEYYGGFKTDVGTAITELSEGGFAVAGFTKSHKPKASFSTLNMILINQDGKKLDAKTQSIFRGEDDNIAHSIVELFNGEDLVVTGSAFLKKSQLFSRSFVGAFTYKLRSLEDRRPPQPGSDVFGSTNTTILSMSAATFFDANEDKFLESGERGYYALEIKNTTNRNLHDIRGKVSASSGAANLDYWKEIKMGTIAAGKSKRMIIPLKAKKALTEAIRFDINVETQGVFAASSSTNLESFKVDPPQLQVSRSTFTPSANPRPGETVKLLMELTNVGGSVSPTIPARFILPSGVKPQGSTNIRVSGIRPGEKQMLPFYFTYDATVQGNSISILFETQKIGEIQVLRKQLYLPIERSIVRTPQSEIFWVTPDPDDYNSKTIDVSEREVDVKVMALSEGELSKKNFANKVNGRRPQGQKMDESILSPPSNYQGRYRQSYSTKIRLQEGRNEIEILYFDDDGKTIISKSRTLVFNYIPKDKPNLFVLSIGVEHGDLKYTVKDARDFAQTYWGLKDNSGRGFRKVDVRQMVNKEETEMINIQKAFKDLRNWGIKDGDLVVVFISSHGKILNNNRYILMPSDYDPRYEEITSIDFNEDVLKQLRMLDGNKLVFIDACHSGVAGSRSFTDEAASKVMNDLIRSTSGIEIFASCSNREFSYEDDSWRNGAFTKAILEAFKNQKVEIEGGLVSADIYSDNPLTHEKEKGSDGVITIEELKIFLSKRVPFLAKSVKGKPQHPTNKSAEHLEKNTGIFMVY